MGNQVTTSTINNTDTNDMVLVIVHDMHWVCLIPKSHFEELFYVVEQACDICELQLEKFQGWYGGWEKYLQTHRLRQGYCWKKVDGKDINLTGIYYLRLN